MQAVLCPVCDGKGWVEVRDDKIDLVEELTRRKQKDWAKCPSCGRDRNSPRLTGCPVGSHYGTYCLVE